VWALYGLFLCSWNGSLIASRGGLYCTDKARQLEPTGLKRLLAEAMLDNAAVEGSAGERDADRLNQ